MAETAKLDQLITRLTTLETKYDRLFERAYAEEIDVEEIGSTILDRGMDDDLLETIQDVKLFLKKCQEPVEPVVAEYTRVEPYESRVVMMNLYNRTKGEQILYYVPEQQMSNGFTQRWEMIDNEIDGKTLITDEAGYGILYAETNEEANALLERHKLRL